MRVDAIELDFFRNFVHLQLQFDPKINLIYGENAQGKTNLLEAIAYLSSARSHRTRFDRELMMFDVNSAFIKGAVFSHARDFTLEVRLSRARARQLYSNGVRLKTAAQLSGILTTVLFCPEDLDLIRAGASERRRFLDQAICQLRPRYAQALVEYHRLHEHKTRILRDWKENPSLLHTLDDFSLRMAQTGAVIIHYRAHFIRKLQECAGAIHRDFSGGGEQLGVGYATVGTVDNPLLAPKEILPALLEHQQSHRQAELEARQCLCGAHKDDILVDINGKSAKTFASQGQTRTAALSLKLAQREVFAQDIGEWPVLLLDDVLSELDAKRQAFVLNRIQGGQVFITCCEEDKLRELVGGRAFHIKKGELWQS